MPNSKAAIKTVTQDAKRRLRNRALRTMLRSQLRKLDDAIKAGDKVLATQELADCIQRLDKNTTKGVGHKKNTSRRKSRLSARVAAMA